MNRAIQSLFKFQTNLASMPIARHFAFQSDLSTATLYPNSKQRLYTPPLSALTKEGEKFNGIVPLDKLKITYSRSSGPGGQNVNKVETKVDLRFHVKTADWIPQAARNQMLIDYKNQINKEGYFVIKSELTRNQQLNLADALERVRNIIRKLEKATEVKEVSPETQERIRRRHEKAARERLFEKRHRSAFKANRQPQTDF